MKLTPLDIRKQEFKRVLRGYDPDEVEAFLVMVADELEMHLREKTQLNDELIKLRTQLRDYQRVESTLRETLVKAQSTIDDTRANSRREAELIIQEAELKAESLLKESRDELARLHREIALLKAQRDSFARRLRHLLESQLEMLSVMEADEPTAARRPEPAERRPEKAPGTPSLRIDIEEPPAGRTPIIRTEPQSGGVNLSRDMRNASTAGEAGRKPE